MPAFDSRRYKMNKDGSLSMRAGKGMAYRFGTFRAMAGSNATTEERWRDTFTPPEGEVCGASHPEYGYRTCDIECGHEGPHNDGGEPWDAQA